MCQFLLFNNFFLFTLVNIPTYKASSIWNEEIIFSFALTISSIVLTIITGLLYCENRAIRKQKITPTIVAFLEFSEIDPTQIILKIKNIGEGLAKNIVFDIKKDFEWVEGLPLSKRGALQYGISSFPPQYELNYILVVKSTEINFSDPNSYIELSVNYENSLRKFFSDNYRLNFNNVTMQGYTNPPSTYKRAHINQLKEINKQLERISTQINISN